eukprot:6046430-Pyramimonas_sp.AAC.1
MAPGRADVEPESLESGAGQPGASMLQEAKGVLSTQAKTANLSDNCRLAQRCKPRGAALAAAALGSVGRP